MKQERVVQSRPTRVASPQPVEEIAVDESEADLLSDIDELLDEIDSILEEQSVLVDFRQRSGQ